MKTFIYVDGESHFIRAEACLKESLGQEAKLEEIDIPKRTVRPLLYFPRNGGETVHSDRSCSFLWDSGFVERHAVLPIPTPQIDGAVYFGGFSGSDDDHHAAMTRIRGIGFDPQIAREPNDRRKQRRNALNNDGLIEKPKGVDIGLAVRLLEDGYRGIFDSCFLFTSDVDFVPVIQALRRLGRTVAVFGFRSGLGKNSPFEHVPDAFVDLTPRVQKYFKKR